MSINQKFNDAKERLVITAQRVAGNYLLAKYGSAHLIGEPTVELKAFEGATSSSFLFSGKITCLANDGLLNQVGVNMTVNENDIEVTSEDVQANVTNALNAAEEQSTLTPTVKASLDAFTLTDDGTIYLKVAHTDLNEAKLGVVGKNEYATSKSRIELLKGIVKDAFLENTVEFTGEFKEPMIEKEATLQECDICGKGGEIKMYQIGRGENQEEWHVHPGCKDKAEAKQKGRSKNASLTEEKSQPKASWLTAELFKEADDDNYCTECEKPTQFGGVCEKCQRDLENDAEASQEKPQTLIAITENMPRATSADHLKQSAQSEEQSALDAQLKVEHEAANELVSLLQGMGYGTAKAVEVTSSKEGLDIMTAVDHNGSVKAVSIPVSVKEGKYTLPKKALISTLIEKGLNVHAKLAEQFDLETLEKLAAIDDRMSYETNEVNSILSEKAVEKTANEGKNTMFEGDTDTLTVQKHLLPNHENLKLHDKISDGSDQWEIVNMGGQQNSKGEGDSSLWTMKKCQAPERSNDEPENKIPV